MKRRKIELVSVFSVVAALAVLFGTEGAGAAVPSYAPCCLVLTAASFSEIDISWGTVISEPATSGYTLQRSTDGISFANVLVNVATTSYSDKNLAANTAYTYQVFAVNADGNGPAASDHGLTSPPPLAVPPTAPTNLTAKPISQTEIDLSWTPSKSSSTITGYRIERGTSYNSFAIIAQNAASTTAAYADTNLVAGTNYFYRISGVNEFGPSTPLTTSVSTLNFPGPPGSVLAVPGDGQATVSWTPPLSPGGTILSYVVVGMPDGYSKASSTATSTVIAGLKNGTLYYFLISAVNAVGQGAPLQTNYVTPAPQPKAQESPSPAATTTAASTAAAPPAVAPLPVLKTPPASPGPSEPSTPVPETTIPKESLTPNYVFRVNLEPGGSGREVAEFQNRLADEGFYLGPISGHFDDLTRDSLKFYQSAWGITVTGSLGPLTRKVLNDTRD